ncbi:hypothetical protein T439DRAFT_326963 [Meredithblackwellia eburnea MCA 4105]
MFTLGDPMKHHHDPGRSAGPGAVPVASVSGIPSGFGSEKLPPEILLKIFFEFLTPAQRFDIGLTSKNNRHYLNSIIYPNHADHSQGSNPTLDKILLLFEGQVMHVITQELFTLECFQSLSKFKLPASFGVLMEHVVHLTIFELDQKAWAHMMNIMVSFPSAEDQKTCIPLVHFPTLRDHRIVGCCISFFSFVIIEKLSFLMLQHCTYSTEPAPPEEYHLAFDGMVAHQRLRRWRTFIMMGCSFQLTQVLGQAVDKLRGAVAVENLFYQPRAAQGWEEAHRQFHQNAPSFCFKFQNVVTTRLSYCKILYLMSHPNAKCGDGRHKFGRTTNQAVP